MQIFIKFDKTYTLTVTPDTTIEQVKKMIQNKTDIPINHQLLVGLGLGLNNEKKLSDYDITSDTTFYLSIKLFSCKCCNPKN